MTWYWWKHWFWITGVLTLAVPLTSVETYPLTPIHKEYKKDKILKVFPLADPTDIDHVIDGSNDDLPGLLIRDRDNQIPGSKIKDIENGNHSTKINEKLILVNNTKNVNETLAISNEEDKNVTKNNDSSMEINKTTKGDDYSIGNNMTLNNTSSNHNSNHNNTLSTNSSLEITSNTSQPVITASKDNITCNRTTATINSTTIDSNRNRTTRSNNYNETIDCEKDTSEESLEDLSQNNNKTTTLHVDLIDDDDDTITNNDNHTVSNDKGDAINNTINGNIMKVHNKGKNVENQTKEEEISRVEIQRQLETGERGRKSKVLSEYRHELKYINFSSDAKNLLARSAAVSLDFDEQDDGNVSSEALSIQKAYILDAGTISGICLAVLGLCFAVTLAGIALYRRRYLNKPQTLSEPDSSGYIDDSTIRDNSDEMYSLDNDSFLNSLEAMTIQNYWTDTVKHTKL